ncbi:hypothetical protein B8W90_13785, partial [Staphylococcus hominis]
AKPDPRHRGRPGCGHAGGVPARTGNTAGPAGGRAQRVLADPADAGSQPLGRDRRGLAPHLHPGEALSGTAHGA